MEMITSIVCERYDSPCGTLILGSIDNALCLCVWDNPKKARAIDRLRRRRCAAIVEGSTAVTRAAAGQLDEYFAGERRSFSIPLFTAGTDFQQAVWQTLCNIPYGDRISYREEAVTIGKPSAVRAVASANAVNALSVFIPCHRVVGSDGSLGGYQGGIAAKRFLLSLERAANY